MKRRSFLKAIAASGLAGLARVPHLQANEVTDLKRLVIFFQPNGTVLNAWTPLPGSALHLNSIMSPLQGYEHRLCPVSGLSMLTTALGPGDGHEKGCSHLLTGMPNVTERGVFSSGGPSIDQVIAAHLQNETALSSIELGIKSFGGSDANLSNRITYADRARPKAPEDNVASALFRLFGGGPEESVERHESRLAKLDALRSSFLRSRDIVADAFSADLSHQERLFQRVVDRVSGDFEGPQATSSCRSPHISVPEQEWNDYSQITRHAEAQMDLLVAGFACDITRVGTLQFGGGASGLFYPEVAMSEGHHDLSHGGAAVQSTLIEINQWYSHRLRYLLEALESVPEAGGSMLDNTLILCVNELSNGNWHNHDNMPFLLAGGLDGMAFGRHLEVPEGTSHIDFLRGILEVFGIDGAGFGYSELAHETLDFTL